MSGKICKWKITQKSFKGSLVPNVSDLIYICQSQLYGRFKMLKL